jgi:hypothetical protein
MLLPLIVLLVILVLFGGLGFAYQVFWYLLIAALIIWALGFLIRMASGDGGTRGRWYYW